MTLELGKKLMEQVKLVKAAYIKSFVGIVVVVLIGLIASTIINCYFPLSHLTINLLQAFSIVPGATALFGKQGWGIQTWCGTTPAEILDQKFFRFFSIFGLLFAVVAFSLNPKSIKNSPKTLIATLLPWIKQSYFC